MKIDEPKADLEEKMKEGKRIFDRVASGIEMDGQSEYDIMEGF